MLNTRLTYQVLRRALNPIVVLIAIVLVAACTNDGNSHKIMERQRIDSINRKAYLNRYISLDTTAKYAEQALREADGYNDGRHEALCHKAFVMSMRADYATAKKIYSQVGDETKNELLMLVADIGLMEQCQRTGCNKEYYDHRNNAQRHIKRLEGNLDIMNEHQMRLWNYAQSEYHFVSATYDFYMNQRHDAVEEINYITNHIDCIREDTAQIAKYCYLRGSGGVIEHNDNTRANGETIEEKTSYSIEREEARELMRSFSVSVNIGLNFFIANVLQGCANNLLHQPQSMSQKDILVLADHVGADYNNINELPLALARHAYNIYDEYGSAFNANAALITIAEYYINHDNHAAALDTLQTALDRLNTHHKLHADTINKLNDTPLLAYDTTRTTTSLEKQWIESHDESVNPMWMSSIREYLSICYSSMGNKAAADYNRNAYLDILDATRQDMEIENRYDKLSQEERAINIMNLALLGLLVILTALFVVFYRKLLRNKEQRKAQLQKLLDLCKKMTAAMPTDAEDTDGISQVIDEAVGNDLQSLFPTLHKDTRLSDIISKDNNNGHKTDRQSKELGRQDRELLNVIRAFYEWLLTTGKKVIDLNNRMQMTESRRYVHEMHVKENKCANINKQACMSVVTGIMPYIDRMTNELARLQNSEEDPTKRADRLQYVEELVDKINTDNEILVHWIKMSQGTLNLNIESFSLQPLLQMFARNSASFHTKGLILEIEPSTSMVRADRALTIFMINTLLDNARKYTPAGGSVRLSTTEDENSVKITVADTGPGLSANDIQLICGEKVYDASSIGMSQGTDAESTEHNRTLSQQKGFGFGLMNCRGIIEKYRRTNKLFSVCQFTIESELGKGSRFAFTLPKGISRTMKLLAICFLPLISGCSDVAPGFPTTPMPISTEKPLNMSDSIAALMADSLNKQIDYYADNVFYCNVDGYHNEALVYADSAIVAINSLHALMYPEDTRRIRFNDENDTPAELEWYKENHDVAYDIVLELRNEIAIAALALKQWDTYFSNNDTYTRMYRLVGQDKSLEQTCNDLQMANTNKQTLLVVLIVLLVFSLLFFFILYYKFYLLHILNMEQYINFSKKILAAEYSNAHELDQKMIDDIFKGFNDVKRFDAMAIVVKNDNGKQMLIANTGLAHQAQELIEAAKTAYIGNKKEEKQRNESIAYPMTISGEEGEHNIGGIAFSMHGDSLSDDEEIILRLMVQLISIYLNNSLVELNIQTNNIELMEDEERRAEHEENAVHVQNMILDNCLSTIKHETMYYPNRIKQMVERKEEDKEVDFHAVYELACYYKDIYSILCANALRQVTGKAFRRAECSTQHFADYARRSYKKITAKQHCNTTLTIGDVEQGVILCDKDLTEHLIDNLFLYALELQKQGEIRLETQADERFMTFVMTDFRTEYSQQELNNLFYPDIICYDPKTDKLRSTQLIVCKQIIREHDEHSPYRGCRIYAETTNEGKGHRIVFTLPRKKGI